MKYQRILAILSIPILVLLIIAAMLADWRYNYSDFSSLVAGGIVLFALLVLVALASRDHGPLLVVFQLIALARTTFDRRYGAQPLQPGETSGDALQKSQQTFGTSAGGHIARLAGVLTQLIGPGDDGQSRHAAASAG